MADTQEQDPGAEGEAPKKKGKKGLLIGLVLAVVLGGGGFYAAYSGMIPGGGGGHGTHEAEATTALADAGFVPLEPLVISLDRGGSSRHLRFRAELEVIPGSEADVAKLTPRVMDVLNSYLRAVSVAELEDPAALVTLRAQMLRRIQLVIGDGVVRDLLIMEFVLT